MKRDYANIENDDTVIFFAGIEIEKTNHFMKPTLFVVGPRPVNEITYFLKKASDLYERPVTHVFLTANQSMVLWNSDHIHIIKDLLNLGLSITMDGPIEEWDRLANELQPFIGTERFTTMLNVPVKRSDKFTKNNCFIKIDDIGFAQTTNGVYVYPASDIMNEKTITTWNEYKQDFVLARTSDLK